MTPDLRIRILAESPLNGKLLLDEMDALRGALEWIAHDTQYKHPGCHCSSCNSRMDSAFSISSKALTGVCVYCGAWPHMDNCAFAFPALAASGLL